MEPVKSESPGPVLNPEAANLIFNYLTLRLIIGFIAFALPLIVVILTSRITSSISASYHTEARDAFVGLLFVIGAFLLAYNGRSPGFGPQDAGRLWQALARFWKGAVEFRVALRKVEERLVSFIGGVAAITTAVFPTTCDTCDPDTRSRIHLVGAVILFSTIAYFCLVAFRGQVRGATDREPKKQRRGRIYSFCGWGIVAVMLGLVVTQLTLPAAVRNGWALTFWAETIALALFGFSWMTASKFFTFLADVEEQHQVARRSAQAMKQRSLKGKAADLPI